MKLEVQAIHQNLISLREENFKIIQNKIDKKWGIKLMKDFFLVFSQIIDQEKQFSLYVSFLDYYFKQHE